MGAKSLTCLTEDTVIVDKPCKGVTEISYVSVDPSRSLDSSFCGVSCATDAHLQLGLQLPLQL